MSEIPPITSTEIETYAARYGLTGLPPAHLKRLAELADAAAAVARQLPRMPSKGDEPGHVFRVSRPSK